MFTTKYNLAATVVFCWYLAHINSCEVCSSVGGKHERHQQCFSWKSLKGKYFWDEDLLKMKRFLMKVKKNIFFEKKIFSWEIFIEKICSMKIMGKWNVFAEKYFLQKYLERKYFSIQTLNKKLFSRKTLSQLTFFIRFPFFRLLDSQLCQIIF